MMRLFAGEFVDVHSYVTNDYWNHDVEDNAYALMRSEHGVVAMLHSSATQWRHRFNLDITLTQGALDLSGDPLELQELRRGDAPRGVQG